MAMSKYMKNFILCGDTDYHCLLCNETFKRITDVDKHVRWEEHRKTLKVQSYLPKFRRDAIFKISSYYYCELCNTVQNNIAAVKTHIESLTHKKNKTTPELPKRIDAKHEGDNVIINETAINKFNWHGIINKKCMLCECAVENVSNHIKNREHIIKLVQSEVKKTEDNYLYRKINEEKFQCFKCKKAFPILQFNKHWDYHKSSHVETVNKIHIPMNDRNVKNEIYAKEYDIEDLIVTDDEYYELDSNNNKVKCKTCSSEIATSYNALSQHLFDHDIYKAISKSNILKAISEEIEKKYVFTYPDHGKSRSEAALYGKQNYIKMNAGGSKGYCTLCDKFLSANLNVFKSHVEGCFHLGHLELKGFVKPRKHVKKSYKTETLRNYLKNTMYTKEMNAFWINMDIVIDELCFMFIKKIEHGPHFNKIKCLACDEVITLRNLKEHCWSKQHKTNFLNAKVVVNLDHEVNEFIREIQPRLYHCGICNATLPFSEGLERHLESLSHKMQRIEKFIGRALEVFMERNGFTPEPRAIKKIFDNDAMYLQFYSAIF